MRRSERRRDGIAAHRQYGFQTLRVRIVSRRAGDERRVFEETAGVYRWREEESWCCLMQALFLFFPFFSRHSACL